MFYDIFRCLKNSHHRIGSFLHLRSLSQSVVKMKVMQSHYDVLGLPPSATQVDIRSAFLQLSKQVHPDLNPGDASSHAKFVRLNEAYSVLSDVKSRHRYDRGFVHSTRARQNSQSHGVDSSFHWHSASSSYSYYRRRDETFWDEFMTNVHNRAKTNEQFYNRDSSFDRVRLAADVVLTFTSLMMFFIFVCVLHVTLFCNSAPQHKIRRYQEDHPLRKS